MATVFRSDCSVILIQTLNSGVLQELPPPKPTPVVNRTVSRRSKPPLAAAIVERLVQQDQHNDLETLIRCGPREWIMLLRHHASQDITRL